MIDNKSSIKYPKILAKHYLLTYLEEMGFSMIGGMGDRLPLSFVEIEAFMKATRTDLNHWEVLAIKNLSYDYIIQLQKKDAHELPPYMEVTESQYLKQTSISASSIAQKFGVVLPR